jgi:hypothetical protein
MCRRLDPLPVDHVGLPGRVQEGVEFVGGMGDQEVVQGDLLLARVGQLDNLDDRPQLRQLAGQVPLGLEHLGLVHAVAVEGQVHDPPPPGDILLEGGQEPPRAGRPSGGVPGAFRLPGEDARQADAGMPRLVRGQGLFFALGQDERERDVL